MIHRSWGQVPYFIIFLLLFLIGSCQKKVKENTENHQEKKVEVSKESIIVGDLDWIEVTSFSHSRKERVNALSVARLSIPRNNTRCPGFLISEAIILTNSHCIRNEYEAQGVVAFFTTSYNSTFRVLCQDFIGSNPTLDFTLLRCESSPATPLVLSDTEAYSHEEVYLIQSNCDFHSNPNCHYTQKYSAGKVLYTGQVLTHDADTLSGSSAAPIFSKSTHQVVAIHFAGLGNDGQGRGIENYAIPIGEIKTYIDRYYSEIELQKISENDDFSDGSSQYYDDDQTQDSFNQSPIFNAYQLEFPVFVDNATFPKSGGAKYFKFFVSFGQYVDVRLDFNSQQSDLDIYLYDESMQLVDYSADYTHTEWIQVYLERGYYYLEIKQFSGPSVSYDLLVSP